MDLTDVLRKRTEADLEVATARSLELSLEIESTAEELRQLRKKLSELENRPTTKVADVVAEPEMMVASHAAVEAVSGYDHSSPDHAPQKPLGQRLLKIFSHRNAEQPQFHWHLDEVAGTFPVRDKTGINVNVSPTSFPVLTMSGWIVPVGDRSAFAAVEITLLGPGKQIAREVLTYQRPDVAAHFGNPSLSSCGFRVEIPMFEIPVGQYAVKISGRGVDGINVPVQAGIITIA